MWTDRGVPSEQQSCWSLISVRIKLVLIRAILWNKAYKHQHKRHHSDAPSTPVSVMFIFLFFAVISLPLPSQEFVILPSRDPHKNCVIHFGTMTEINCKTGSPFPSLYVFLSPTCPVWISRAISVSSCPPHRYQTVQTRTIMKHIILHCLQHTRLCDALQGKPTCHSWFIGPQELAVSVVQIAHVNLTCKGNYTCFLMSMTVACASSTWIVYGQSQGNDLAQIITHARHISLRCTMSSDTTIFAHRIVSPLSPPILLSPVHS